jgi:SAM domain (Sterile alpha motif)
VREIDGGPGSAAGSERPDDVCSRFRKLASRALLPTPPLRTTQSSRDVGRDLIGGLERIDGLRSVTLVAFATRSPSPWGTLVDIAAWLRELGLERYEQAFQDNEVTARSLPHLHVVLMLP